MAEQALVKKKEKKVYTMTKNQTEHAAKEVKILNIKPTYIQPTMQNIDIQTSVLNFLTAAGAFRSALKQIKTGNYESNELQNKEIIKELVVIQNQIKQKILNLKEAERSKTEKESLKTRNTECSTQSSLHSQLSNEKLSSSEYSRNNSLDSESEPLTTYKLMSLSTQSLSSIKSSQTDHLEYDDDDDDDEDEDEKFQEYFVNVNCPFCLKHEGDRRSFVRHLDRACTSFKSRIFVKAEDRPYSVFQLLANNAFKCNICPNSVQSNIKSYFKHSQSEIHVLMYNKAASRKKFTELIFCSVCKIQIPNTATQILFHVKHKVHQRNGREQRSTRFYQQKGIQCIYTKEKKFKCLNCPPADSIHKGVKGILQHIESETHTKRVLLQKPQSQKFSAVYCMFCLEEVSVFNVFGHFNSSGHTQKEAEEDDNKFELCVYCDFTCSKLNELAQHMDICPELDLIRQEVRQQECEESDRVLTPSKSPTEENTSKKGRCIIVKDCPKILELYHYFSQFGKVLEIEPSGENAVMIKFQEEKTVDHNLESWRKIEINGVKLKITRKEDLDNCDTILESSRTAENTNSRVSRNDGSDFSPDAIGISNSTERFKDVSKAAVVDGGTLEKLFHRVSSHLLHNVLKSDCEDFLNIALDCEKILKLEKCHSVGFLKSGLTFPVEKITLYCELSDVLLKEKCLADTSTSLTESIMFNESMCKKSMNLFKNSNVVSKVSLREESFPFVEFYHNKTHKLCTITFRQSDYIVSEELRYCLKDDKELRSVVLIIRFWLSVHKLKIREFESVIISLLLFFLLSSGVVKSSENFTKKQGHLLLNHCDTNFAGKQDCRRRNSIVEMFQKFLLFLSKFDFENMAICLPLVHPVPKTKLSEERLKKYLCKWFDPNSPVWIMDPFLFNNFAVDVKKADWDSLLKTVRETIEHYDIS